MQIQRGTTEFLIIVKPGRGLCSPTLGLIKYSYSTITILSWWDTQLNSWLAVMITWVSMLFYGPLLELVLVERDQWLINKWRFSDWKSEVLCNSLVWGNKEVNWFLVSKDAQIDAEEFLWPNKNVELWSDKKSIDFLEKKSLRPLCNIWSYARIWTWEYNVRLRLSRI